MVRAISPLPSFQAVFSVAPVGFLVEAIPIAPGGMGTAHLAFEYLLGSRGIAQGAGVFNVYFVVRLLASLVGGILWAARNGRAKNREHDVRAGFGFAMLSGPRPRIDDQSPRLHW
jgi:hypothetical protein